MIMLLFLAAQFERATPTTLPPKFVGAWAENLALCGKEDTRGVVIEPAAISFYEARGAVRAVSAPAARMVSAVVDYAGEGRSWTETNLMQLTDGTLTLTALGETTILRRCPPANGS
ncbi:MAG TPA: hypothetical protein VFK50_07285 [Sphingomicrobium sp.]|nr:hypothetical protein [Sphingomicrobium sp.]